MRVLEKIKPLVLSGLIAAGFAAHGIPVQAQSTETLTVAGGCFWCVESDFESVPGVVEAISGYTGGTTVSPTYKDVTKGGTGHYEAVQIVFDPAKVSRGHLINLFFRSVDPTDPGGQFCDRGDSYRTAVFVSNGEERSLAEQTKAQAQQALGQKIVTPILSSKTFFQAEDYHQDYYKGDSLVFTRFGPKRQAEAYKRYRQACGRDARVIQLWGDTAPFAKGH
ncbi:MULTISPECIES: peptide-methionine (S)-S-oxide reductase MsrA [unclassified Leisingera]|uniref:peptide-methionine (S)-S-oxide reductase MsrA n=1 Tax=unclassified Leisingera TaxID=2614906 RepID=UPI0003160764|nr:MULTISPECIES: peptide-methionine (S)-S-oxide reductase MsrA [unclassified Leisingera]KIC18233.1 peptide methionine sulfoxide reductase [Leisingera sp. ANG-DT]KIC24339.1 peptide methionine sulfoxide reductase [Leisingera sp. ANG-S3]KIC27869.1 peptide methionine sulfoxide reductase [Leisingera sp. ANG-M6]KIC32903.1 peptide methionine sulfoxide reductase [Leisingera sp. ANG-S5]KIC53055.1 peptide methionine sulfoxide reductase [Leisingera sp. ANG-S]